MTKTLPVSIRMTPELKDAIAKLAKRDRRSLSVYIELVLEEHVRAQAPDLLKQRKG